MSRFLGKYAILIVALCLGIYVILVKLSVVHTVDLDYIFAGYMILMIGKIIQIENKLGRIMGILETGVLKKKKK